MLIVKPGIFGDRLKPMMIQYDTMPTFISANIVSVLYQHRITSNFLVAEYPRLINCIIWNYHYPVKFCVKLYLKLNVEDIKLKLQKLVIKSKFLLVCYCQALKNEEYTWCNTLL